MFQYENPFFQGLLKLVGLISLCAAFLLCCLPVFTAGASFAALYESIEKNMKHDRSYPLQAFFTAFRSNFRRTTLCFLVILAAAAVCGMDIFTVLVLSESGKIPEGYKYFFIILLVLIAVWAVWVLAECVRFENRTGAILKNGLSLMLLHIPASLGVLGILAAGVLTIYLLPVTILVMPGVMVWFITMLTESVFRSHMTPEERREYDERNRI